MSEVTVRALGTEDWQTYQQIRLAALQDAPVAFASSPSIVVLISFASSIACSGTGGEPAFTER